MINIYPAQILFGDDSSEPAVVFRVRGTGFRECFPWIGRYEQFFSRYADTFATVISINFGRVGIKP